MSSRQKKISAKEATLRLMNLCSQKEKSSFEIRQKLKSWELDNEVEKIIEKLISEKFINDHRFAKAFSHDKFLINKWGKIKIKYSLRSFNIPDNLIDESLSYISDEEYSKMIQEEMTKKNKSLKVSNHFKRKARLYAFGNQRGYEPELIQHFCEQNGLQ